VRLTSIKKKKQKKKEKGVQEGKQWKYPGHGKII
jgi:hypothetical protein